LRSALPVSTTRLAAPVASGRFICSITQGEIGVLGTMTDAWGFDLNRLAVSPDSKTLLIQRGSISNDLMLIENFR
jgi:hypothetical protein